MHSRIFCVGICIFGLLLKIRERFSLLRAENEEAGRTISLHKCQMEKMPAQRAQGGMGLEQAIIDIRNMYKIYNPGENEVRALDGVSLAVYKGEFVAIVGHSGSGKSTLMNMIGCLDTPTSGTYFLNGQDVSALSDNALSAIRNEQIGFIFQNFNLIKNLNALENVELPLIYRGLPAGKRRLLALEALERVGLASRMDHRPNQMSGGQQQRVAVARAIAAHPPLILADEPTGNLDTRAGARVFEIIRALHAEGNTIVLITHDEGLARKAQRIVRITDGKIDDGGREVF